MDPRRAALLLGALLVAVVIGPTPIATGADGLRASIGGGDVPRTAAASIVVDQDLDQPDTIEYDHIVQHTQTGLEFLRERAARLGYDVRAENRTLSFGKRDPPLPFQLTRFKTFHPCLSSTATVRRSAELTRNSLARRLLPWRPYVSGARELLDGG